ncbi:Gfo/Idh/MocA family protein [Nitrosopumilus sp.]|uniref:Gfo/Idh/MocA family protein n=1 Tax=Nitrosopumilus sp. TaxID=2024843 RepID=UPI0034A09EE4
MTPIRFGIIGCSRIARRSVIPAIIKSEFSELEFIGSRSTEKAKEFSKEFNCKKFGMYEDVISDKNVDAVYISTPIGTHEEWSVKAALEGKHIYCEKSSTTSFESAKNMIECSKQNNVRIMEGFMFRFHPQHKKVKELIDTNKIGDLISFDGKFGFPAFPEGDIRYNKDLGGGFLNDSGCYPIAASRMIFDKEPVSVSCNLSIDPKTDVDIRGTSYLVFDNKNTASITYGNGNYYQAKYDLWGSEGIISSERAYSVPINFETNIKLQFSSNHDWTSKKDENYKITPTDHFLEMINEFCLDISQKQKSKINFENELENQAKVMEAHRLSNNKQRLVSLDEIN